MTSSLRHLAVIMDGNGRWATQRGLARPNGHLVGAEAVKTVIELSVKQKIDVLSLFALSQENYQHRPSLEVNHLMALFTESLRDNLPTLNNHQIRIRIIGDRSTFHPDLLDQIEQAEQLTVDNSGLTLVIAINYSGRWDVVQATRRLLHDAQDTGLDPALIDETRLSAYLCLSDLPEPDLLIRTSGEQRISNFFLWQFAYTEIYFTDVLWPDFNARVFQEALAFYQSRQRRFGLVHETSISQRESCS